MTSPSRASGNPRLAFAPPPNADCECLRRPAAQLHPSRRARYASPPPPDDRAPSRIRRRSRRSLARRSARHHRAPSFNPAVAEPSSRPPAFPPTGLLPSINWKIDNNLSTIRRSSAATASSPASFAGVADSGTIVLHHSPSRRPPRPHPAAGLPSLHSPRLAGRRDPARILRPLPGTAAPRHVHLRPQRHRRHRNDPHQRRPWPPLSQRNPRPRRPVRPFAKPRYVNVGRVVSGHHVAEKLVPCT